MKKALVIAAVIFLVAAAIVCAGSITFTTSSSSTTTYTYANGTTVTTTSGQDTVNGQTTSYSETKVNGEVVSKGEKESAELTSREAIIKEDPATGYGAHIVKSGLFSDKYSGIVSTEEAYDKIKSSGNGIPGVFERLGIGFIKIGKGVDKGATELAKKIFGSGKPVEESTDIADIPEYQEAAPVPESSENLNMGGVGQAESASDSENLNMGELNQNDGNNNGGEIVQAVPVPGSNENLNMGDSAQAELSAQAIQPSDYYGGADPESPSEVVELTE